MSGDGNTVAIGAISNDEDTTNAGHVRVYDWDGSDWTQRGSDIDGKASCDSSGYSVSLSDNGNTVAIIIGAPDNNGAGYLRVFDWEGTDWTQRGVDIDGAVSGDALGFSVSLSDEGNTVAISAIGVNTAGRVRVYDWDGTAWTQRGQDMDAEGCADGFGWSVSLFGDSNTVAIGATFNDGNGTNSGHVRVYYWVGTAWTKRGQDIDGEAADDESGHSVSLSNNGNTVAIGAIKNDGTVSNAGQVRVYDWDGTAWTQRGSDIDGDACVGQEFGFSVSLSEDGDTLVASAHYWGEGSGKVRVFDWDGTNWTQRYNAIEGAVCAGYTEIGMSVSLSNDGNIVAIGGLNPSGAGLVLVIYDPFPKTESPTQSPSMSPTSPTKSPSISSTVVDWTQRGADIDGEASNDYSGQLVSLSADGNTVAIGAMFNDGNGSDSGHVRFYGWDGTNWTQRGQDIDGEAGGDYSGSSVSLSDDGNTVAIGASDNDGNGSNSGHVRVYDWDGTNWAQRGADIDGAASDDRAGIVSLSDDGNTVAIGSYYADSYAGHVRVFDWDGTNWTQRGADIVGEASLDYSCLSVSLSNNANTVAIGADSNDGNAEDSGHVRVYDWNGTSWTQRGADIDGEAEEDRAGGSVSLSDDGNTVAIGAYWADGPDYDLGNVRVFDWDGTAWTQRGADIFGEGTCDNSGSSTSLSGDGNTVAIGANYGNYVTVYDWDGTAWTLRGARIDAESSGDRFGYAVSISSNGNVVAIGATLNDGNGSNSGHVRVFKWPISD